MIVDWEFIKSLEGKPALTGYVPQDKEGNPIGRSGVTVAVGFDIGQQSYGGLLDDLRLPPPLVKKLYPYIRLKGRDAIAILSRSPLVLTKSEADTITDHARFYILKMLSVNWYKDTQLAFASLPGPVRTVLFSLAYNFGPFLHKRIPNTYKTAIECAKSKNWLPLYDKLITFPSKNPQLKQRRIKEAAYLRPLLKVASDSDH